ncbi:MAG: hypothetical protein ACOX9C_05765 [Kiritimatiellia bacterium]|jgi:hypothetical protein
MSLQNHDAVKRIKHVRRPKKKAAERLRRQKEQKKRLLALGFPQEVADKMNPREIRMKVARPKQVLRELARAAEKAEAAAE